MTEPTKHYGTGDLSARVADALRRCGLGEGTLRVDALAPLDQFHVGGAAATASLAACLSPAPGARLLDIGCGLGGPARYMASVHGCDVTGIDLSQPFVDVATMLTERSGLSATVRHLCADATDLPFAPRSFDLAWTQHVAMNIADRAALYAGIWRVLRPGGLFALYDIVAVSGEAPRFPVPWASDPANSFLLTADATRAALEAAGFIVRDWADATERGQAWAREQLAAAQTRPETLRALALPLVMGPGFPVMAANLQRSLREGRVGLLQAVVQRSH
jgi:SAM-dependent methyltransferase